MSRVSIKTWGSLGLTGTRMAQALPDLMLKWRNLNHLAPKSPHEFDSQKTADWPANPV
jgi:hypothetical protein